MVVSSGVVVGAVVVVVVVVVDVVAVGDGSTVVAEPVDPGVAVVALALGD